MEEKADREKSDREKSDREKSDREKSDREKSDREKSDRKKSDNEKTDQERGVDIEALLAEGKSIRIHPQGYSMYPLFVPGRDEAVIAPANTEMLKRGDVVLYRREGSILVLHRIWKRTGEGLFMVGDNQKVIEGPLKKEQVKGILCQVIRRGKCFSVRNPFYRLLSAVWLMLRPMRPALSKAAARMKRVLRSFLAILF